MTGDAPCYVLDRLSDAHLEFITRNDVERPVERACERHYSFARQVLEKLAYAMEDGEIVTLMRMFVNATQRTSSPLPKMDVDRLARMNQDDRHAFFQCVRLSHDRQSLEFVDSVHQWIDDEERAMLLERMGIDSRHVAQMLRIGAPWRDWMHAYVPDRHDSDEVIAAWRAMTERLPPVAAARLLNAYTRGDHCDRRRIVRR